MSASQPSASATFRRGELHFSARTGGGSVLRMRPPAPWSPRFWRLPVVQSRQDMPLAEQLRPEEVHWAGGVFSPGGWTAPSGTKPGWDWLPEGGGSERQDKAPGWVLWWLNLPFVDRWAHVWMWEHGCYEVNAADAPEMPPPAAGVREPLRPKPPKDADGVRLGH